MKNCGIGIFSFWRYDFSAKNWNLIVRLCHFRIRAQFGQDIKANAVHGSSTNEHAQQSIKLVFGEMEFTPDGMLKG